MLRTSLCQQNQQHQHSLTVDSATATRVVQERILEELEGTGRTRPLHQLSTLQHRTITMHPRRTALPVLLHDKDA